MKKRAIICGGTSGIGKAIACLMCKEGYSITIISKDAYKINLTLKELSTFNPENNNFGIEINFNNPDLIIEKLISKLILNEPHVVLVNNVGGPLPKNIIECTIQDYQNVFNNLFLSFSEMTKFIVPHMRQNRWGRIINILGTTVTAPLPHLSLSVIKSATANWAKALSYELGPFGITVNNVLPGPTTTKELSNIVEILASRENKEPSAYMDSLINKIPLRRIASPLEIAEGVVFLASEKSSYITGTNLKIDGGFTNTL